MAEVAQEPILHDDEGGICGQPTCLERIQVVHGGKPLVSSVFYSSR